jgi:uncharacterized membrane protein
LGLSGRGRARDSSGLRLDLLLGASLVLAAAIFRLVAIGNQSLWLDEIGEATTSRLPWDALLSSIRDDAAATPLDYLGVRLVTGLFGSDTVATRLWAVAVGSLAAAAVYFAARRLFGSRAAGVLSGIVLIASPFAIYYGQEARFYSLTMLVSALSVLAFLRAWENGGVKAWLAFAGISAILLYTHYFAAGVLLASQAGFVLLASLGEWLDSGRARIALDRGFRRGLACAASMVIAVVIFVPWFLFATLPQIGRTYGVLPPPLDLKQIGVFLGEVSGGLVPGTAGILAVAVTVAVCTGVVLAISARRFVVGMLVGAIALSIPVAWLADVRAQYYWTSRQIAFVVPLLCILAGGGLWALVRLVTRLSTGTRRSGSIVTGVVAVAGIAWVALSWTPIQRVYAGDLAKDDWRGVTALVSATACPDATFHVNVPAHYQFGIGYYDSSLTASSEYLPPSAEALADVVPEVPFGVHDWLIVLTYAPGVGSIDALSAWMVRAGWSEHTFVSIRAFERGAPCGR